MFAGDLLKQRNNFFFNRLPSDKKISKQWKKKGGICFCVKNTTYFSEFRQPVCSNNLEIMGIKVSNGAIFILYNPPSNSIDKMCLPFISIFPYVIIYGDFTAHCKMWDFATLNQRGVGLLAFIKENDYSL